MRGFLTLAMVNFGAAEKGRDVEGVGLPVERNAGLTLELVNEILGEIGVRALVVAVDPDPALCREAPARLPAS